MKRANQPRTLRTTQLALGLRAAPQSVGIWQPEMGFQGSCPSTKSGWQVRTRQGLQRTSPWLPQDSNFKYHFKETLKMRESKKADLLKKAQVKFWAKEEEH